MIVARTTKGKGVSFMENNATSHGAPPTADEYRAGHGGAEPWSVIKRARDTRMR